MGPLGWQETVFIFVLALLLFGPKKLPEIGKTLGKAMTEFRRASSELKSTFDREMKSLEQENDSLKAVTGQYQPDTTQYDYSYDSGYDGAYTLPESDSTATSPSTISASAPQGAESPSVEAPEGVVAYGTGSTADMSGGAGETVAAAHHESAATDPASTTGHKA